MIFDKITHSDSSDLVEGHKCIDRSHYVTVIEELDTIAAS